MKYADLKKTDFWDFFGVHEVASSEVPGAKQYELKTGGFQDQVDILLVEQEGSLVEARLTMASRFVGDTQNINMFAKDIAKSFVITMDPLAKDLAIGIWQLEGPNTVHIGEKPQKKELPSEVQNLVDVYIGKANVATWPTRNVRWTVLRGDTVIISATF